MPHFLRHVLRHHDVAPLILHLRRSRQLGAKAVETREETRDLVATIVAGSYHFSLVNQGQKEAIGIAVSRSEGVMKYETLR